MGFRINVPRLKSFTFFARGKLTVNRPVVFIFNTNDDISALQGVPRITFHCDRSVVGHRKLDFCSKVWYVWQSTAFICGICFVTIKIGRSL